MDREERGRREWRERAGEKSTAGEYGREGYHSNGDDSNCDDSNGDDSDGRSTDHDDILHFSKNADSMHPT